MTRFGWIAGSLGVIALAAFGAHAVSSDAIQPEWAGVGIFGVVMATLGIWLDRASVGQYARSRGARYSLSAVATVLIGAGVAVALNVLAVRYDKRWDITASGKHALSEQTLKVLGELDRDVAVHAFFPPAGADSIQFKDLVEGFEAASSRVTIDFHDPLAEPLVAREFEVTSAYGTVVLVAGEDRQRLESRFDEEALTNALIRLTSGVEHVVCFTTGHEELDPDDDQTTAGLGLAVLKLEGQNYRVEKLSLLREGTVPERCAMVVIADPQVDWLAPEKELLAEYVVGGGSAILLLEPARVPGLAADLARYNVAVGDDIVLEQNPYLQQLGGDASYIVVEKGGFDFHDITNPIKGGVLLRIVRSVGIVDASMSGLRAMELMRTSPQAWAESDYLSAGGMEPNPGVDRLGPVPMAVVVEVDDPSVISVGQTVLGNASTAPLGGPVDAVLGDTPVAAPVPPEVTRAAGGRLVVFGDAEFAGNELLDQSSNADLFLNTIAWLAGEDDQVSIRPNPSAGGSFTMTLVQGLLVFVMSLIIAPGLAVMGAIGTWRQRRAR